MSKNYFIENGYLEFKNLLDKSLCKKLNDKILKTRKIDEKIFFEIQDTGNLVSTSIPFLLHRVKNKVKNNSKLLFSAFGVGLTFSSLLVDYENNYN